eukprot:jgi/Mesvir1/19978/Mv13236-RA.1
MATAFEKFLNFLTLCVTAFLLGVVLYTVLSGKPPLSIGLKSTKPPAEEKEKEADAEDEATSSKEKTAETSVSRKEKALTISDTLAEQTYRTIYVSTNPIAMVADMASMLLGVMGAHRAANGIGKAIDAVISRTPLGALFGALLDPKLSAKCKARQILSFGFSRCGGILSKSKPREFTKEEETPIVSERFSYKTYVYNPETKTVRLGDTAERFSVKENATVPPKQPAPTLPTTSTDHVVTVGSERFKY